MNSWTGLLSAALAFSILELDAASVGQFMISRPIVFGPVMGAVVGQPGLGTGLGALCELFCLEALPVGGSVPPNASVAGAAALVLALGAAPVAVELALPAGLFAGWAHARLEVVLRRGRGALNALVERRLAEAGPPRLAALAVGQALRQAAMTLAVLLLVLMGRGPLRGLWLEAPEFLRAGFGFGLALAPWPAAWALLRSFRMVS